jgi:hypothetical protein
MAVLTLSGVTFGGADNLNSKYGIIPQSAKMVFLDLGLQLDGLKLLHKMIKL